MKKFFLSVALVVLIVIGTTSAAPKTPTVTITSAPPALTTDTSATFAWSKAGRINSTECSLDNNLFINCISPITYNNLSIGNHNFVVRVTGRNGVGIDSHSWEIISEEPPPPSSQCSDGLDNDGDGLIDYPNDPGCVDANDNDETNVIQPPPPPPNCTNILNVGGDLSNFVSSLTPGDIGCLRQGTYNDGQLVTWSQDATSGNRIVLQSYPGEFAEIVGTEILLSGDYLTLQNLTVRDVVHIDGDGVSASGIGARFENLLVKHIARNGILLHTSSRDVIVTRNFVDDVGWNSSLLPSQAHGIYVQGSGHIISSNVFTRTSGYGIHLYSSPSQIIVSQNTAVASVTRTGILIRTSGGNVTVVNNIFDRGTIHTCTSPCLIDKNLVQNGWSFQTSSGYPLPTNTLQINPLFADAAYRLQSNSPAIDIARSDYSYSPDKDGILRPQGSGSDLGAYER